jgi:hypothetical protein
MCPIELSTPMQPFESKLIHDPTVQAQCCLSLAQLPGVYRQASLFVLRYLCVAILDRANPETV